VVISRFPTRDLKLILCALCETAATSVVKEASALSTPPKTSIPKLDGV
jgi:hypothetical protein